MYVHAYFWGTDSQYHYDEDYAVLLASVSSYPSVTPGGTTIDVYGYATYDGYLPWLETHAWSY
jgi:hypothetical protein